MTHLFLSNTNKELLWEVLLDEDYVKTMNKEDKIKLYESFNNHRKSFYELEKYTSVNGNINANTVLVEMNKRFLTSYIQNLNLEKMELYNSVNINQNTEKYKIEDIHAERQAIFEKQLTEKQQDFANANIQYKPPSIDFSEKIEDTKIKGMDELIAKTIAQRNYEISQIHNSTYNTDIINENEHTNINLNIVTNQNQNKNENIILNFNKNQDLNPSQNQTFKQIKIENIVPIQHEVINLHTDKKISRKDTNEIKYFNKNDILMDKRNNDNDNENESNIFNKLKKIAPVDEINEINKDKEKDIFKKIHILTLSLKEEIMEYKQTMDRIENKVDNIERKLDILLNKQ
jgi:hypothetical protein